LNPITPHIRLVCLDILFTMLVQESFKDVPTKVGGSGTMRMNLRRLLSQLQRILTKPVQGIFIFHPTIAGYPHAKFPGVVVFSEIYQGELF
jgi:carboxymethylenebutenolidase